MAEKETTVVIPAMPYRTITYHEGRHAEHQAILYREPRREPPIALDEALDPALFRSWLMDHERHLVGEIGFIFGEPLVCFIRQQTGIKLLNLKEGALRIDLDSEPVALPVWAALFQDHLYRQCGEAEFRTAYPRVPREAALRALNAATGPQENAEAAP